MNHVPGMPGGMQGLPIGAVGPGAGTNVPDLNLAPAASMASGTGTGGGNVGGRMGGPQARTPTPHRSSPGGGAGAARPSSAQQLQQHPHGQQPSQQGPMGSLTRPLSRTSGFGAQSQVPGSGPGQGGQGGVGQVQGSLGGPFGTSLTNAHRDRKSVV